MKTSALVLAFAVALLSGAAPVALAAKPAPAAAASAAVGVNGVAIANLEAVAVNSNAFKAAQSQRPTTYKAQYDQAEARKAAIQAQLNPLIEKFTKDRAAPGANQAALQSQAQTIQAIQEAGTQELQKILQPAALSEAYVQEQINDKLAAAVQAAMAKNGVSLLLNPQSVLSAGPGYNLGPAILAELNTAMPSAQLVPPAGWVPREERDRQAAAAAGGARGTGTDGR